VRWLRRGPEPRELADTRKLPRDRGGTYDALPKPPVIEALLRDQGGLCGFCMRPVRLHEPGAHPPRLRKTADGRNWPWKIAHWAPQSHDDEDDVRALDWSNMIGACRGGDDGDGPRTCDTLQGNQRLTVDPYKRATVALVRGRSAQRGTQPVEGEVESTGYELRSDDAAIDDDLRLRLGLNRGYLPANRAEVLQAFRALLQRGLPSHGTLPPAEKQEAVRRLYDEWKWEDRGQGRLRPYCGVVEVHYRLAR